MKKQITFLFILFLMALSPHLRAETAKSTARESYMAREKVFLDEEFLTDPTGASGTWVVTGDDLGVYASDNWEYSASHYMDSGTRYRPTSSDTYTITSPKFGLGLIGADLSFSYKKTEAASTFAVYALVNGVRNTLFPDLPEADSWTLVEYSLASFAGDSISLVFEHTNISGKCYLDFVKAIEPPLCPPAKHIAATSLTSTTCTFTWDNTIANQFVLLICSAPQTSPATPNLSEVVRWDTISVLPSVLGVYTSTITTLTVGESYDIYLRPDCSNMAKGMGNWSEGFHFKTPCGTQSSPYSENFDSYNSGEIPLCWVVDNDALVGTAVSSPVSGGTTNLFKIVNDQAHDCMIALPMIDDNISNLMFTFSGKASKADLSMCICVTQDITDFESLITLFTLDMATDWTADTVYFNNSMLTPGRYYVVLYVPSGLTESTDIYNLFLDDIEIKTIPFCRCLTGLETSNIMATTCDLSWLDANPSVVDYTVEYTAEGGVAQTMQAPSSPFTLTGLTENRSYSIRVKANCSATEDSEYTKYQTIKTKFIPEDLSSTSPIMEDFEAADCDYHFISGTEDNFWTVGTATAYSPTHSMYFSHGTASDLGLASQDAYAYAYTDINVLETGQYILSFAWRGNGNHSARVRTYLSSDTYLPLAGSSVTTSSDIIALPGASDLEETTDTAWQTISVEVNFDTMKVYRLIFQLFSNEQQYYYDILGRFVALDDIALNKVMCEYPENFVVDEKTAAGVKLSWQGTSDSYEVRAYSQLMGLDTLESSTVMPDFTFTSTSDSVTCTGLASATTYYFYVQGHCGTYLSSWVGPASGDISCPVKDLPYFNDFESQADGSSPMCFEGTTAKNKIEATPYGGMKVNDTQVLCMPGLKNVDNVLILPEFSSPLNAVEIEFDYSPEHRNYTPDLLVGYLTDISDDNSMVVVDTIHAKSGKKHILVDYTGLPASAVGRMTLLLENHISSYYGVALDNLMVYEKPDCTPILSFNPLIDVFETTATISWKVEAGSSRNFIVEYGPKDFLEGTGTLVNVTDTFCAFTGLTPQTEYTLRVTRNCGVLGTSSSSEISFSTLAHLALADNYRCDFEDTTENNAWILTNMALHNSWEIGTQANNGGTSALYIVDASGSIGYFTSTTSYAYATRSMQFSAGLYTVSFDYKAQGESSRDYLKLFFAPGGYTFIPGSDNGLTASTIPEYWLEGPSPRYNLQYYWTTVSYILDVPADGVYTLGLYWKNDSYGGSTPGAQVDNLSLKKLSCYPAQDLSLDRITMDSVSISWTNLAGDHALIRLDTVSHSVREMDDVTSWSYTSDTCTTQSIDLTGLAPNTSYYLRVMNICSATDSATWSEELSFKTLCGIHALPFLENFDSFANFDPFSNQTMPECWTSMGDGAVRFSESTVDEKPDVYLYLSVGDAESLKLALPMMVFTDPIEDYYMSFKARMRSSSTTESPIISFMITDTLDSLYEYKLCNEDLILPVGDVDWHWYTIHFDRLTDIITGQPVTLKERQYIELIMPGAASIYVDSVGVSHNAACSEPYDVVIDTIEGTSITLSWNTFANTTEIEYVNRSKVDAAGVLCPDTMRFTTTATSYVLNGLTNKTSYSIRLRAHCSDTNKSLWTHALSFTTECGKEVLPYSMDFESDKDDYISSCWILNTSSSYIEWESATRYDASSTDPENTHLYRYGSSSTTYRSYTASMTTSMIDLTSATFCKMSFEALSTDVSGTHLMLLVEDLEAGTTDTLVSSVLFTSTWKTYEFSLENYVGHTIRIGFYGSFGIGDSGVMMVDNLLVEDALLVNVPLDVFVDHATQTSVMAHVRPQASVSDYNFAVMQREETFDETTATIVTMSAKDSVLIPSLVAGMGYKLYAQSQIGTQKSAWVGPVYFFTACSSVHVPINLSFESGLISPCWCVKGTGSCSTDRAVSGTQCYVLTGSSMLISPEIIEPLNTLELYLHNYTYSPSNYLEVGVMSDTTDMSTKIPLDILKSNNDFSLTRRVSLAAAPVSAKYIYVENRSRTISIDIDDIDIELASACEMNADVTFEKLIPGSACVRMNETSTVYDLVWGEVDSVDILSATPLLSAVPDSTTITGLKSNTVYEVYVRTNCGSSTSHWFGPYSFTSACGVYTITPEYPYLENMNSLTTASYYMKQPQCWTILNNSGTISTPSVYAYSSSNGGVSFLQMNSGFTDTVYAVTPSLSNDLSTLLFSMSIKGKYSPYYSDGDNLTLGVMSNPMDPSTFISLKNLDLSSLSSSSYHDFSLDGRYETIPSTYSYFAIRMRNTSAYVRISDFRIEAVGSCAEPTIALVSSTSTSATIHFDYAASAASFDIAVTSEDGTYNDTTYNVTLDSLYIVRGLCAYNVYTIMARTHCVKNGKTSLSNWSKALTCLPIAEVHRGFPYFCGFEDITENNLWSKSRGGLTNYWVVGTSVEAVKEGSNALYITCDSTNSAVPLRSYETQNQKAFTWASRTIHFEPGGYHIAFKAKSGGESNFDYLRAFLVDESQVLVPCDYNVSTLDDFNGTTLTRDNVPEGFIDLLDTHFFNLSAWREINADIIVLDTTDYQLAFLWRNDRSAGDSLGVTIDSISITRNLCALPTGLAMVDIDDTMATAAASGFGIDSTINLRYVVVLRDSTVITSNIIAEVMGHAGDTVSFAGLNGSTSYDLYCTRLCEGMPQEWTKKITFKTLTTVAQVPYTCGFESTDDIAQWSYANDDTNAWMIGDATAQTGTQSLYISNNLSNNVYTTSSSQVSFAYRTVHFPQGEYILSFDWKGKGENPYDYMYCFVVPGDVVPRGGVSEINGTSISMIMGDPKDGYTFGYFNMETTWQTEEQILVVNEDCDMNVIFCWNNNGPRGVNPAAAVDNFSITASSCFAPFNVQATDISGRGALLTWEGEAMSYRLQIEDDLGFVRIDTIVSDTSFRVTGLNNSSSYTAKVRSICSAFLNSLTVTEHEFSTNCGIFPIPYFEGFEGFDGAPQLPHCWSQATGLVAKGDTTLGCNLSTAYYGWYQTVWYKNNSRRKHAYVDVRGTYTKNWLKTPEFVLDSNCVLMFDAALTDSGHWDVIDGKDVSDDRFVVMLTRDHGVHWTEYAVWDNAQAVGHRFEDLTNDFVQQMLPIAPESTQDTIQLAFYAESTFEGGINSIHIDNVSLGNVVTDTVYYTDTICQGTPYGRYGFNIPSDDVVTGQYKALILKDINLELHLLDLWVKPSFEMDTTVTICHGQSYSFSGLDLTETGYYRLNLSSASGCDSLINLSLMVTMLQTDIDTMLCEGQSITLGTQTITSSGVYTDTLRNAQGCDSLINLSVWIIPTTINIVDTICEGSYAEIGSTQYTTSGQYSGTLQNVLGCDSVVNLDLTVLPLDSMMVGFMCEGSDYAFFGTILNKAGFYIDTIHNYLNTGCDRIYKLTLTETLPDTVEIADQYCEGMSSYNQYGFNINDPETKDYIKNLSSMVTGCDSVTILHLSEVKTVYSAFDYTMCDGEAYDFGGSNYYVSGVYEHTFLASGTNCDSVVTLNLTVNPTYEVDLKVSIGENKLPYTNLDLTVPAGTDLGTYDYRIEAKTTAACDSIINLTLTVTPPDGLSQVLVNSLDVVPNVVKRGGVVTIKTSFSASERRGMDIRLYDAVGRMIKVISPALEGDQQVTMPAVSGAYFLRITTTNGVTYSAKLLVM